MSIHFEWLQYLTHEGDAFIAEVLVFRFIEKCGLKVAKISYAGYNRLLEFGVSGASAKIMQNTRTTLPYIM